MAELLKHAARGPRVLLERIGPLPAGGRAKIACQLAGLLSLIHTFSEYGDDFVNDV
jgi:hypothetical protein